MKPSYTFTWIFLCLALNLASLEAEVPGIMNYQGRLTVGDTNYTGPAHFKFALIDGVSEVTYWSNDGSSLKGSEPGTSTEVTVEDGAFAILLGDTGLTNMQTIPASVFSHADVRLRIWVRRNELVPTLLTPDQRVAAAGYALQAAGLPAGAVTATMIASGAINSNHLANGSITGDKIATNSIGSTQIGPSLNLNFLSLGNKTNHGTLTLYHTTNDAISMRLEGNGATLSTWRTAALPTSRLGGDDFGTLHLYGGAFSGGGVFASANNGNGGFVRLQTGGGATMAELTAADEGGGMLELHRANGAIVTELYNTPNGGQLRLWNSLGKSPLNLGKATAELTSEALGGFARLYQNNGKLAALLGSAENGGYGYFYQNDGGIGVLVDGDSGGAGQIEVRDSAGRSRVKLQGQSTYGGGRVSVSNGTGRETVELLGAETSGQGGQIRLWQSAGGDPTIELDAEAGSNGGGRLDLRRGDGKVSVTLKGQAGPAEGSSLTLTDQAGATSAILDGDSNGEGAALILKNRVGQNSVYLDGDSSDRSGSFWLYNKTGKLGAFIQGEDPSANAGGGLLGVCNADGAGRAFISADSSGNGAALFLRTSKGTNTVELIASETDGTGAQLTLRRADGSATVEVDSDLSSDGSGGGYIRLRNGAKQSTITLQADANGEGKITTQVLQITGGSDLSERFDISAQDLAPEPGMVVCIDPDRPGELLPSRKPYDRTVAGIISGAGGVRPGMLMGQAGTAADGRHPVALTGRVYCKVDANLGAVKPGDLLTTAPTPGHAMKVADHNQAQGAILGKAMTPLDQGTGLVLVLVSLQ